MTKKKINIDNIYKWIIVLVISIFQVNLHFSTTKQVTIFQLYEKLS